MSENINELIKIVKIAGKKTLGFYRKSPKVFKKIDRSIVTEADLVSQKIIFSILKRYNYGILSEESKDNFSRLKQEKVWILDPLDGSLDFLQKTGEFSIMLGLVYKEKPILGLVYLPATDKMYFAEKNKGSFVLETGQNPKRLKVSNGRNFLDAKFVMSRNHLSSLEKMFLDLNKITDTSYIGSIGVKLGLIAEGKAEGYLNSSDKTFEWDICAPQIILEEAGGRVTDLSGEKFSYNRKTARNINGIVASNKKIHEEIIEKMGEIL